MAKQAFWDGIAVRYAARPVTDPAAYEETLVRTRSRISGMRRVLEVGCGTGMTALKLADSVDRYVAVDFSAEMLRIARARPGAERVEFREASLSETGEEEGSLDAVLAFSLLHLMDDPEAAIRDLRDLLRPGGLLVSKTVCLGDAAFFLPWIVTALRLVGKAPRIVPLRAADLEVMIVRAGFEILDTATLPKSPPCRFVVARKTAQG